MILKKIDYWWGKSSIFEKTIAFFIGFYLGDLIESLLKRIFSIDSFLLTTITGILSIYLIFFLFSYINDFFHRNM